MSMVIFRAKVPHKKSWKSCTFLTGLKFNDYPSHNGFDSSTMMVGLMKAGKYVRGKEGKVSFFVPHVCELAIRLTIRDMPTAFSPFALCSYEDRTFLAWTSDSGWNYFERTFQRSLEVLRVSRYKEISPIISKVEDLMLPARAINNAEWRGYE